jgi:predicted dienelactone hydrolase
MRTIECLLVLFCIPAIAWTLLIRRSWPLWIRTTVLVAGLLLPIHAWIEGAHWQMAPVYLSTFVLVYLLLRQSKGARTGSYPGRTAQVLFGVVALLLVVAGLALSYALPMFHLKKPTGPYAVGTRGLYFVDPNHQETHPGAPHGNRQLVVQVWYPSATNKGKHAIYRQRGETDLRSTYQAVLRVDSIQDAPLANGRFPVVIFNHAWRGFRNRSTFLMQELASQGFVVVSAAHPYNASIVQFPDGSIADGRTQADLGDFYSGPPMTLEQRLAIAENEVRIQTDDDKYLIDQLALLNTTAGNPFEGHLDVTHVGAFGHSFGGTVAAELAYEDPRVVSALMLDGALHGPVATVGLSKPLLELEAEGEGPPAGSENSPIQSVRVHGQLTKYIENAIASSYARFGGYKVVVRGIDHENFTDKGFFSPFHSLSGIGNLPQQRAATIIDAYTVAFFKQTLLNQPQALLSAEQSPFPEVAKYQKFQPASEVPIKGQHP